LLQNRKNIIKMACLIYNFKRSFGIIYSIKREWTHLALRLKSHDNGYSHIILIDIGPTPVHATDNKFIIDLTCWETNLGSFF